MLNNALSKATTVAIGGHVRPDGDCVGSCMALYQYVKNNFKNIQVDVYLEEIPDSLKLFDITKEIKHTVQEDAVYDLFIAMDCGDVKRLGFSGCLFENAKETFCIDHHVSNQAFADNNYIVSDASSTSELAYRLMDKELINTDIAECLYLGIVHDTGVFQYSCTSPETMEAAADLMRRNIRANEIIDKTFYEKTYAQNQILGRALLESSLSMNGKCIVSFISKQVMDFYGVTPKDLDGIVSQLRVTKGVEVAMFLYETAPLEYKVSLRATNDVDVSIIAQKFGGGGHKKAAGVTMNGSVHDIIDNISAQIELQL